MIGYLVRGRIRIKIKIRVRVRVGVTFNVRVYRWSNCRRSKCRTFSDLLLLLLLYNNSTIVLEFSSGRSESFFSSFAMLLVVTELPVDCPGIPETVNADPETNIYTLPYFGPDDVTLSSGIEFYFPHPYGTDFGVIISPSNHLIVGTNTITTVISDDELSKTCVSTTTVTGHQGICLCV